MNALQRNLEGQVARTEQEKLNAQSRAKLIRRSGTRPCPGCARSISAHRERCWNCEKEAACPNS
jgi:hypothetical protein